MQEEIKRGDIYYADMSPVIGSEQGGFRPVLVVQNDVGNRHSPTVIVVPLTTAIKRPLPTHVTLPLTEYRGSTILCEAVRTIDKRRLKQYKGAATADIMRRVDNALRISLGL